MLTTLSQFWADIKASILDKVAASSILKSDVHRALRNLADSVPMDYDPSATYLPGQKVYYTDLLIYRCTQATVAGESPASAPTKWVTANTTATSPFSPVRTSDTAISAYEQRVGYASPTNITLNPANIPFPANGKTIYFYCFGPGSVTIPNVIGTDGVAAPYTLMPLDRKISLVGNGTYWEIA